VAENGLFICADGVAEKLTFSWPPKSTLGKAEIDMLLCSEFPVGGEDIRLLIFRRPKLELVYEALLELEKLSS
jgi:hypothetical protein